MTVSTRRPPRPEDLQRFRLASRPRLSPAGTVIAFVVQDAAPRMDGYRQAIWLVPADGSQPARQVTLGARHDTTPTFSPDGRTLAFLSDRRTLVEEEPAGDDLADRADGTQVHLLPLDGGEARRLTDLPRGATDIAWSPDGRFLAVTSGSLAATDAAERRLRGIPARARAGAPPQPDIRYIDRLRYQANGKGFIHELTEHLWLVDAVTGEASRLTDGTTPEAEPAWSPDGRRIAFVTELQRDPDLAERSHIAVVDVATRRVTPLVTGAAARFSAPAWLPDGRAVAALGGWLPANSYRKDVWLLAADGSDASPGGGRNLSGTHDLMPGSAMNSDLTIAERPSLAASADGRWLTLTAPILGGYQLFRIATDDGRLEQLTDGRQYVSSFDQVALPGGARIAAVISSPLRGPDIHVLDLPSAGRGRSARGTAAAPGRGAAAAARGAAAAARGAAAAAGARTPQGGTVERPHQVTALNDGLLDELALVEPVERWVSVDGRRIQGWLLPAGTGARPLVTEIHGGPHTLYGWSPMFEFQVLAGQGISVFACNPRGSEGYGLAFNEANLRDWGPGPMRDILAGIDGLVAEGLADPDRLGVTGGSYGGYLTNWIVGHDQRFRAAMTCRCVSDMTSLHLTGDLSSGDWPRREFGAVPWDDWAYFREISPITYAREIRTPLLIQHAEQDLRCTIAQAEALFTVLRSLRRPVRLMRVPGESHELTRSGTPFRRVAHLAQVRDWFVHYLVKGGRRLPPLPRVRSVT